MKIQVPKEKIAAFCRKWKVLELALFGSVLRDDFRQGSDVDVLITFAVEAKPGILDMAAMKDELKSIFGRDVDVVEKRLIEKSENYIRKEHILESTEVVYGPSCGLPHFAVSWPG